MTGDYTEVFDRFGIAPQESIYPFSPVFLGVVGGRRAVVKRTHNAEAMGRWVRRLEETGFPVVTPLAGPYSIGGYDWVAYPWIDGRGFDGGADDLAAAGELLGRMHADAGPAEGLSPFEWPEPEAELIEEDIAGLAKVLDEPVAARLAALLRDFPASTLPAIRDAELPMRDVSMDFKATNLVYTEAGPVLIDPDNGDRAPRLLDLALAVLLFHNDLAEPGRLFDEPEWIVFRDAYLSRVELTAAERELWPTALLYMLLEWGVWSIVSDDWNDPVQAAFLTDLAAVDTGRFPLS
ncbi:phosphotransferase [Nonomuraea sp. NPDC046570]|uniref:phosphotransferase enzyme family protein n=1 Tax=Nonomuraea sp. NPDC046570 TaxID=3155255 RepID=UPI0033F12FAF